ncbi:MAG: glycosyltransferase family 2 protein [Rhodobacteraceae bacterium]|nr:glycosyltransferase family 2 protein [Paracoccaceae bacterium]
MSDAPAVTVVTPVHDAAGTLAEAVASVQAQTMGSWEMILVDDGSADASRTHIRALADADGRLRPILWDTNRGPAAARNAAIAAARGRFIAFLDADDRWRPEKLARQIGYMEATGAVFTFTAYRRIDAAGRPLGRVGVPSRVTHGALLKGNVIGCLTAVYDAAHFGRVEMPNLPRRQDYGLWLRLLAAGGEAHGIDEELAEYRVHPGSLSAGKLAAAAATWRLYREAEGLGRARAGWYLAHNLARGLAKRRGG